MNPPIPMRESSQATVRTVAALLFILLTTQSLTADIATLREKGPFSGSLISTPGLLETAAPSNQKISMQSADVRIRFRRGVGDQLAADVDATFDLLDHSAPGNPEADYLVDRLYR